MSETTSDHYNADYFIWQQRMGEFGGKANTFKFKDSISPTDTVLDFGCGGGFLLKHLDCRRRIGIEPNASAHSSISGNGVEVYSSPQAVLEAYGEGSIDVIISNNALEHVLNPLEELKALYPLLKQGGTIHFAVPCDSIAYKWKPNDINFHLYSWSPMNIGNIFTAAGFKVIYARTHIHKWPRRYEMLQRVFGWGIFNLVCRVYGRMERSWFQVHVKAIKE